MTGEKNEVPAPASGGFTLFDLLLVMTFLAAFFSVFGEIRSAGGGMVRYLWGFFLALLLGFAFVAVNWKMMLNFVSRLSRERSTRIQNLLRIAALIAEFVWGVAGMIAGSALTEVLIKYGKL